MNKEIHNVRYAMDLGCGRDVWRIVGDVNGKSILPSSPVEFNGTSFKTASGSIYTIMSYQCDPAEFAKQIAIDIANKGYEVH